MKLMRSLSVLLSATLTMSTFSMAAMDVQAANNKTVKRGGFYVTGAPSKTDYKNGTLTVKGGGDIKVTTNGRKTSDRIKVVSSKKTKLNMNNVKIETKNGSPAIEIQGRKGADLAFSGNNTVKGKNAGILYRGNEKVSLGGNGSLTANSDKKGNGINCPNGSLEIKNGTINSNSGINAREIKILGGSINSDTKKSVLRNGKNQVVYKQQVELYKAPNKKINKIQIKDKKGKNYNYSVKGMRTDRKSRMTVYVPAKSKVLSASIGKKKYSLASPNTTTASEVNKGGNETVNNSGNNNETVLPAYKTGPVSFFLMPSSIAPPKGPEKVDASGPKGPSGAPAGSTSSSGSKDKEKEDTVYISAEKGGDEGSFQKMTVFVNSGCNIMLKTAAVDPDTGKNNPVGILDEILKGKNIDPSIEITNTDPDKGVQKANKYRIEGYSYTWESGDPRVARLQSSSSQMNRVDGLVPGASMVACKVAAKYHENKFVWDEKSKTYKVEEGPLITLDITTFAVTVYVLPSITKIDITPKNADVVVGGAPGSSTSLFTATIEGVTSDPSEMVKENLEDVEYSWREIPPKEGITESFIDIKYKGNNIGVKPGETADNFVKGANAVTVIAKKEAQNIRIGVKARLKYRYIEPNREDLSKPGVEREVVSELTASPVTINISDKTQFGISPQSLNLKINGKAAEAMGKVDVVTSGIDIDNMDFEWWETSGPDNETHIDFSNSDNYVAEENDKGMKSLPVKPEDKKKMHGRKGSSVMIKAIEEGVSYLHVKAHYNNPDTGTSYTKESVCTITVTDAENKGGSGSGGSGSGGWGGGGSGSGGSGGSGSGGQGSTTGNGGLDISELPNVVYNTRPQTPQFTVKSGINILRPGIDYDYTFMDNTDAGTATLYIDGKNQYSGFFAKKTFTIAKADLKIKDPVLVVNTFKASNYTYDLSKLLPLDSMSTADKLNTSFKLGNSSLPKANFSNITNGGNTPILSFDAKGITTPGTQGTIQLNIKSDPNFNPATVTVTVRSDDGIKAVFHPENGKDTFTQDVSTGGRLAVPPVPVKPGANFRGWFKADGTQWDFGRDVVNANVDLYAAWSDTGEQGISFITGDIASNGQPTQNVIDDALKKHRDLKLNDKDKYGKVKAQWFFDVDTIGNTKASDYDLGLDTYDAEDSPAFGILKADADGNKGLGLTFSNQGKFPAGSMVKVAVDKGYGLNKGDKVYLYKYDPVNNKLKTLPRRSKVMVDNEGFAQVPVVSGGDYILTAKRPASKNIVTLKNQIKIGNIKTAKKGQRKQLTVYAPDTMKKLRTFSQKYPYYYGGYKVRFGSSNKKVAAVSKKGSIKFKKKGTVKIKAVIDLYNGTKRTVTRKIKVK